jgi:purine-binding chemotaxis protein CheW
MQDAMSDSAVSESTPLLKPTEALLRGFELESRTDGSNAAVTLPAQNAQQGLQLREGFHIGHLGLMIRYEKGSELIDLPQVFALPNAPEWFSGIANLHGTLVPVFDLARYLDVEHLPDAKPMLLVLGHGIEAAGVVIDGMPVRLRFDAADRAEGAPIPMALDGCVTDTYWADELTWMDLHVDALLNRLVDDLAAAGK